MNCLSPIWKVSAGAGMKWHNFFPCIYKTYTMRQAVPPDALDRLIAELGELDRHYITIGRKKLKPSQCYRYDTDPAHIIFNTNCPQHVRAKVQAIFLKYVTAG